MSALIILVQSDPRLLRHTEALLSEQGFLVEAQSSLAGARHLLESVMPDLLIAELRLDEHNGLELAIRNQQDQPDLPVIITSARPDPIAEEEAKRYGATFIVAPLENRDFLPVVRRAIDERRRAQRPIRRWLRTPVAAMVEVAVGQTRATVLDFSYGGVRLAFQNAGPIPTTFDIALPRGTVTAHRVWTAQSADDDQVCCGAELIDAAGDRWREYVDSFRDPRSL
jgi:DNA-binding response OmpR family regulator